ncbi:MAG: DUF4834 domain-containing protein, partial [Bacteroidota bacterium]
ASFTGLIRIIFWLIVFSAIFRFFIRLTANYAVKKVNEEVENQRKQGDVSVHQTKENKKAHTVGEYVDFKEIKD